MAGYILMISEIKLKESTALNGNIDPDYILPYIKISQRKYMEIKLGTKLYNHILELIKTGDIELVARVGLYLSYVLIIQTTQSIARIVDVMRYAQTLINFIAI